MSPSLLGTQLCISCVHCTYRHLQPQRHMLLVTVTSLATLLCRGCTHAHQWLGYKAAIFTLICLTWLCGGKSPSFSFPGWYLQCGIATPHLRAFLPLKRSVVLQHWRNSQGSLIFLQTLVCKVRTNSPSQSNLPVALPHNSDFTVHVFRLSLCCLPAQALLLKIPIKRQRRKDVLKNVSFFFQEQLNLNYFPYCFPWSLI